MSKILLGVCGGISAYKSCDLVRDLQREGHEVRVVLTEAAEKFVTRVTFEALTRTAVPTDLFGDGAFGTAHIEMARWADLLVVAPMTANAMERFASGAASDLLSTVYLAYRGRVIAAPAMNTAMWEHPAVRKNLALLTERSVEIVPPVEGELACGEVGTGKMAEVASIVRTVRQALGKGKAAHDGALRGKRVVITAGPTREYLDPVRFLSSPSTGRMGMAVAREAARRGADVTAVHGPVSLPTDFRATFHAVTSAREMFEKVRSLLPCDIFIGTAAVADYRPKEASSSKIKKGKTTLALELERTDDILAYAAQHRREGEIVVGFAAETEQLRENLRQKLNQKDLDLVVGNLVWREAKGFGDEKTSVVMLDRHNKETTLENVSKEEVAAALLDRVEHESR